MIFREATLEDSNNLIRWKNDQKTREFSLDSRIIGKEEHNKWLKAVISSSNRKLYIAYKDDPLIAVGSIRLDKYMDGVEISWTVAPEERGRGIGTEMLISMIKLIPLKLYARIKDKNIASLIMVKKAGFTRNGPSVDGVSMFVLDQSI